MKTIWKFKIEGHTVLRLPKGAKILSVLEQFGDVNMWVLVNPTGEQETRRFSVFTTGDDIHFENLEFVGTVKLHDGRYMVHVFEVLE
jgi:hypothetical protein